MFGQNDVIDLALSIARTMARSARIRASTVSWASLALGFGAGCSIGRGHLALGAAMSLASWACSAIDGDVAREAGAANGGGGVLDASVDRYAELFVFGGVAVFLRASVSMLIVALGAMGGAVMVSYAGAKAEALRVDAPRGLMDRRNRAACVIAGIALTPIAAEACARFRAPDAFARAPLAAALALIAVAANASAILRLAAIVRAVRRAPARGGRRRPTALAQVAAPPIDTTEIASTEIATNGHAAASDAIH